jgi:hypothetical protein
MGNPRLLSAKEEKVLNKQVFQFPIVYTMPTNRIAIGWGVHETVADECKQAGIKKALITTTGLKGTGIVDEINQILTGNGIATEIYDKITSNNKDYEVMEAYDILKKAECDGVVSVGGGSSHDCGKCVRMLAANEGKQLNDFILRKGVPWMEEAQKHDPPTLPQITLRENGPLAPLVVNGIYRHTGGIDNTLDSSLTACPEDIGINSQIRDQGTELRLPATMKGLDAAYPGRQMKYSISTIDHLQDLLEVTQVNTGVPTVES